MPAGKPSSLAIAYVLEDMKLRGQDGDWCRIRRAGNSVTSDSTQSPLQSL